VAADLRISSSGGRLGWFLVEDETSPEENLTGRRPPVPLQLAAVVVALQGLFAGIYGIAEALNTHSSRAVMGATTSLFFAAFGVGMLVCAWGLNRVSSWARGPVMLAQLMSLGLAWNFRGGETTWISVVLAVPAVIALIGMLHPATIEALNE
jgi:peptidoglycan/LPS O-acetylase OafA/YrhL